MDDANPIPLVDVRFALAIQRKQIDAAIARVIDSGVFIGGPEVEAFEAELAAAIGAGHAIGVSSGTDALLATLMAIGIGPGDEVITTPLSFFATAGAIARLGARPVFADVDHDLCLDPTAAEAVVSDRTRAVIPVNLFGRPSELPAVTVPTIEDAAQSLGSGPVRGKAAAVSFFPTKNLGAFGDAGAVLTDDAALADRIALLRTHGARPKYHHLAIGGNFRLDAIQAAVLRAKLPHLAGWLARRRALAGRYRGLFGAHRVPPELRLPAAHDGHTYHQFAIRAPRRDALRAYLAAAGVGTEVYYPEPLHLQPCFAELGYRPGACPIAERACRELLALPIHPALGHDAQDHVVAQIAAFYA
jgi:dTDP-4-amino-4,6-dideoxygalactose transaminase